MCDLKKRIFKKSNKIETAIKSAIIAFVFVATNIQSFSYDVVKVNAVENAERSIFFVEQNSYSDYYDLHIDDKRPSKEILINGADYKTAINGDFTKGDLDGKEDVLIWNSSEGKVTYNINVPETGVYNMELSYYPIESNTTSIELALIIDGEIPYGTASRISLNKSWINEKEIITNARGNQVRPSQIQKGRWMTTDLKDIEGLFNDPLCFYLEKGEHTISFDASKAYIGLEYFKFYNKEKLNSYQNVKPSDDEIKSTPSTLIRIEGENAKYKSDSTLYPTSDKSSYLASPSSPGKMMYNTIGALNWKKATQSITWEIDSSAIKKDGWYKIGIKARQDVMRGFYSNRRLYVNDNVLCEEHNQIKFFYDTDWNIISPKDENEEYTYVYLKSGEKNTITLEAIPGEIGDSMRKLNTIVQDINKYYRKILMVTGPTPDKFTDYNVHKAIPELVGDFEKISAELKSIKNNIEELSKSKGSEAAGIERMYVLLDKCIKNPLKIPSYLTQLKDNVAAISSWMRDYKDQPLEIDYIEIASSDMEFSSVKENAFKSLSFGTKAFVASFFEDYSLITESTGSEVIDVWVSLGRDQALAIKELVESDFMVNYDIPISINIVQGGVMEATLAGKGPDIALFLGGEFPVNLAARGLTVDMKQFEGCDDVVKLFHENATVQYEYKDGLYAIPIQQNFPMMFYRKDILSELDFDKTPDTWEELINMLPAFQRNYMTAGLILPPPNIAPSTEAGHTFATLLMQKGLGYYNEEQTKTNFDTIEAVQAFETWTDFYTKYKFEQQYDAFSRFRDGTYPIVIQNYTFYNQLKVAAPEINGLWDFGTIPGTKDENGNINHSVNSGGSGAVIFNKVKNKENAWEFVKWFTSTKVQTEYATTIEGLMGTLGRFDTANTEALSQISWTPRELDKIMAQRKELEEIPVLPSSYAVTRNIMTAFRATVNDKLNPRDTIMWYNRDINAEITRKRKNLGLE